VDNIETKVVGCFFVRWVDGDRRHLENDAAMLEVEK
jgi:hypothetical protein